MTSLESFFKNPFNDPKVSFVNFRLLMFDHLGRLKSNNPNNLYDDRITATQLAMDQYDAVSGSKSVEEAIRKGATFTLDVTTDTVMDATKDLEKKVSLAFKNPSAIYLQFFPLGLTEYHKAGRGEWPKLLIRLKTATETHKGVLTQAVANEFAGYQANYSAAENTQVGSKGNVGDVGALLLQKRQVLADEGFSNLLTIAFNNRGNLAAAKLYFDQSIVGTSTNKDNDGKANIDGVVRLVRDQSPIGQVTVLAKDGGGQILGTTTTDPDGTFRFVNLTPGQVFLNFTKPGLQPKDITLEALDYDDVEGNVDMEEV